MTDQIRTPQIGRPSMGGEQKLVLNSRTNPNGVVRAYFNQVGSKTLPDPFAKLYTAEQGWEIIKPPVNPYAMIKLIQENSHLLQCIDAMTTNIHGFGYRMEFIGKEEDETSDAAILELKYLEEIFDSPNLDYSFHELRSRVGWDYYALANAYIEVGRDAEGRVMTMHHVPSPTMRITKADQVGVPVMESLPRFGKVAKVKTKKHFRRYVQLDERGKRVYFKEFGDPRVIDPRTGKENPALSLEESATEIIHLSNYNAQSVYGIPLWHTQLPSVLGSRQAELTNLDFFENNGIPAMAILVSGGYLTEEAYEMLRDNFDQVKGRGSTNRIVILEARGSVEDASNTGAVPTPSITLKPLYSERQNDALFQEYERQSRDKIRSVYRLPPVFTGTAGDYTYASAKVSLEIAENQIFIPERVKFDDLINKKLVPTWDAKFWRFRSNPASLATSEDLIRAVEIFNDAGAISPNNAINILNEKLNLDIPRVDEFWGDLPYQMVNSLLQAHASPEKAVFIANIFKMLAETDQTNLGTMAVTPKELGLDNDTTTGPETKSNEPE